MNVSHVHCQMIDLSGAVRWFAERWGATPSFSDARLAVLLFDQLTLILDAAATDSAATIGLNSADCDADFAAMVARGAIALEPPQIGHTARASPTSKGRVRSPSSSSICFARTLDDPARVSRFL
jgi:hypothetical protein